MEALGIGLEILGQAISAVAGWSAVTCIVFIITISILIYDKKLTLNELKSLFEKHKRY